MKSIQVILFLSIFYIIQSATIPNLRTRNGHRNTNLSPENNDIEEASQAHQRSVFKRDTQAERNKKRCEMCRNTQRCKKHGKCGLCEFYCNGVLQEGSTTVSPLIVEPESAYTFTAPLSEHIALRSSATETAGDEIVGMPLQTGTTGMESSTPIVGVAQRLAEDDPVEQFRETVVPKWQSRLYTIGEIPPGPQMESVSKLLKFNDPTTTVEKLIVLAKTRRSPVNSTAESANFPLIIDAAKVMSAKDSVLHRLIDRGIDEEDSKMFSQVQRYLNDAVIGKKKQRGKPELSIGDIDRIIDFALIAKIQRLQRQENETLVDMLRQAATNSPREDDTEVTCSPEATAVTGPLQAAPAIANRNDNEKHLIESASHTNPDVIEDALDEEVGAPHSDTADQTVLTEFADQPQPDSPESSQVEEDSEEKEAEIRAMESKKNTSPHRIMKIGPTLGSRRASTRDPSSRPTLSGARRNGPIFRLRKEPEESADSLVGSNQESNTSPIIVQPTERTAEDEFVDLKTYADKLDNMAESLLKEAEGTAGHTDGDLYGKQFVIKDKDFIGDEDGIYPITPHLDLEVINSGKRPEQTSDDANSLVGNENIFITDESGIPPNTPSSQLKEADVMNLASPQDEIEHLIAEPSDSVVGVNKNIDSRGQDYGKLIAVPANELKPTETPEFVVGDQRFIITDKDFLVDGSSVMPDTPDLQLSGVGIQHPEETRNHFTTEPSHSLSLMDTTVGISQPQDDEVLSNFGKVVSASGSGVLENTLKDNVFFIGNGIKLPLKVSRNDDGSLQLAVDVDRLCNCKDDTCPRTHSPLEAREDMANLDDIPKDEQQLIELFNAKDGKLVNRAKRTIQDNFGEPAKKENSHNTDIRKRNSHHFIDETYDDVAEIKKMYRFPGSDNNIKQDGRSMDSSEEIQYESGLMETTKNKINIKERLHIVKEILDWMKNLASTYVTHM